jgi:hypothetical protein
MRPDGGPVTLKTTMKRRSDGTATRRKKRTRSRCGWLGSTIQSRDRKGAVAWENNSSRSWSSSKAGYCRPQTAHS